MNIQYDAEADVLIFIMKDVLPCNAIAEPGGVIVSYNENKDPVSIELLNASKRKLFDPGQPVLQVLS